jgi:hypothetical protein
MSTRILKIAIPAAFAFALLMPNASQASAVSRVLAHEGQSEAGFSRTTPTDISAQSSAQRKKNKRSRAARAQAAPAYQPYTSGMGAGWGGGWRPADPSFDQNGRPYQPPPGLACPVDLGYGRWGSCDDDF